MLKRIPPLIFFGFLSLFSLEAFTFSPISQDFRVEGKKSSHVFTITNDSLSERIAVKISIKRRIMALDGSETLEECPGDFSIYPGQSILSPGDQKNVRIKWTGGQVKGNEKSYRVIAEQLPVDFSNESNKEEGAGIRFTYRYEGSIYVVPEGSESMIELTSVESIEIGEQSFLELTFSNTGGRHALLNELNITFTSRFNNFESISFTPSDLKGVAGENVLSGQKRIFLIPEPPQVKGEELLWEMTHHPIY